MLQFYSFLIWKNSFVQAKITEIVAAVFKLDVVSSQSAFTLS